LDSGIASICAVRIKVTLAVGLALTAITVLVALQHAPLSVVATNGVRRPTLFGVVHNAGAFCQNGEAMPHGTEAIRLSFAATTGPRIAVEVLARGREIAHGAVAAGWYGSTATVAVTPLAHAYSNVTICARFGALTGYVAVLGRHSDTPLNRDSFGAGRLGIAFLRSGARSWWSLAGAVVDRLALGRATSGTWIIYVVLGLVAAAVALASLALTNEMSMGDDRRRLPSVAWICAAVAFLNAASWSLVTPAFQAPDEPSHFAYVQDLAETGALPTSSGEHFSAAEEVALQDLRQAEVRYSPQNTTISSKTQQRQLHDDLAVGLSRVGPGAGVAASEPPLYYALETIPYLYGSGGTILDSLALMRLLSALMAGAAALFVFLFLRQTLPAARWAWTVGGLGVAFAPLLAMMSGAVNPDALLCAVSAALFYCLACGFRRRLTPTLALLLGALIAAGLLSKLSFIGLLPGTLLGLVLLTLRSRDLLGRAAYRLPLLAGTTAVTPVCAYVVLNLLTDRSAYGAVSSAVASSKARGTLLQELSYIWQFFLPRLPGMHAYFPGLSTTRRFWIDGFVGLYGWVDTVFPTWVYNFALIPLAVLGALLARGLLTSRQALRDCTGELAVYATMTIGLLVLMGASDYLAYPASVGSYAQPRYLLPVIALYGAGLALAARGAGRRWGPVVGVGIVTLLIAHDIFSQLLEISRYYG
jgi:hypothetical protein